MGLAIPCGSGLPTPRQERAEVVRLRVGVMSSGMLQHPLFVWRLVERLSARLTPRRFFEHYPASAISRYPVRALTKTLPR